jgi:hypothetical protein
VLIHVCAIVLGARELFAQTSASSNFMPADSVARGYCPELFLSNTDVVRASDAQACAERWIEEQIQNKDSSQTCSKEVRDIEGRARDVMKPAQDLLTIAAILDPTSSRTLALSAALAEFKFRYAITADPSEAVLAWTDLLYQLQVQSQYPATPSPETWGFALHLADFTFSTASIAANVYSLDAPQGSAAMGNESPLSS